MALPKEPRQKMINLMYLVLTALLALNVSSEILNAFKTVKESLDISTGIAYGKTTQLFNSFQRKMADPATRDQATVWNTKAQEAKKLADEMYKYLDQMQLELKQEAGFDPAKNKDSSYKIDDLEAATRLFISGNEVKKTPAKGKELYTKLVDFKKRLLAIDTSIAAEFMTSLPLSLPKEYGEGAHDWGNGYFHMTPTIAGLTILSKFQNDVRNSEAQVVEFCHKKIGEVIFTYDEFKVIANTSSSYMMPGEEFSISAGIGAYSSQAQPSVSVGGMGAAVKTPDGDYMVKGNAENTPGAYSKMVTITYKDQKTGQMKTVTREIKYTVGAPAGLTVSTDKTRVLYVGLDNPVKVTGSGGAEQTTLTAGAGATVEGGAGGNYIVKVTAPGRVVLTATDKKSGKSTPIEIPVKRVPLPEASVGGVVSGSMTVKQFKAQGGVLVDLKDFIFEGVRYNVDSYFMMFTGAGFPEPVSDDITGPAFSQRMRAQMGNCQEGTMVIIGNIKVTGPGGSRVLSQGITLMLE